jgi:raffinose/stachyose/melibiose transport system substrate-binding protein
VKILRTALFPVTIGILFGAYTFVFGAVKLTWWNLSSRKELTEKIIADFQKENPDITITPALNAPNDHQNKLKVAASSGTLPDFWFNWGGTLGSFYVENGLTLDLSDYAKNNNWDKKFSSTALSLSTFDGNLAGYPTSINMIGIFYRKDIFNECGLKAPETFEEFENVMATLKSKGYTPMVVAGKGGWHLMRFVEALIEYYAGSTEHDKLKALKTSWNTPSVIRAYTKFKEYIDKGYFPKGFVTLGGSDAKSLIYSKDAVMAPEGPWMESNIYNDKQDPNLYGYFKFPLSQKGNRMSGFVEMFQFNKKLSKEKLDAAMKFADFVYSPESIQKYGPLIKQPVPRLDNKLPDKLTMTAQMIDDLNKYGSYTITDQGLTQEVRDKFFEAQQSIATGVMTPEQAAKFMEGAVKSYKVSLQ